MKSLFCKLSFTFLALALCLVVASSVSARAEVFEETVQGRTIIYDDRWNSSFSSFKSSPYYSILQPVSDIGISDFSVFFNSYNVIFITKQASMYFLFATNDNNLTEWNVTTGGNYPVVKPDHLNSFIICGFTSNSNNSYVYQTGSGNANQFLLTGGLDLFIVLKSPTGFKINIDGEQVFPIPYEYKGLDSMIHSTFTYNATDGYTSNFLIRTKDTRDCGNYSPSSTAFRIPSLQFLKYINDNPDQFPLTSTNMGTWLGWASDDLFESTLLNSSSIWSDTHIVFYVDSDTGRSVAGPVLTLSIDKTLIQNIYRASYDDDLFLSYFDTYQSVTDNTWYVALLMSYPSLFSTEAIDHDDIVSYAPGSPMSNLNDWLHGDGVPIPVAPIITGVPEPVGDGSSISANPVTNMTGVRDAFYEVFNDTGSYEFVAWCVECIPSPVRSILWFGLCCIPIIAVVRFAIGG